MVFTYCKDRFPLPSVWINDSSPLSAAGYIKPLAVNDVVTFKEFRAASDPDTMTRFHDGILIFL
jgi:hypothetical protein